VTKSGEFGVATLFSLAAGFLSAADLAPLPYEACVPMVVPNWLLDNVEAA
jgi:hypothetical protein